MNIDDLPGMWDYSDFTGGQDAVPEHECSSICLCFALSCKCSYCVDVNSRLDITDNRRTDAVPDSATGMERPGAPMGGDENLVEESPRDPSD
jgi:hypothetical protein